MITFAIGLTLRRGDRTLEFERDLGDGRVQFALGETREIQTFKLTEIYSSILEGAMSVVRPAPTAQRSDRAEDVISLLALPLIDVVHNHSITRSSLPGPRASFLRTSLG